MPTTQTIMLRRNPAGFRQGGCPPDLTLAERARGFQGGMHQPALPLQVLLAQTAEPPPHQLQSRLGEVVFDPSF